MVFRYNALHVACMVGSDGMAGEILTVLATGGLFSRLYPDDTAECSKRRRNHCLDQYLNMPDKGVYGCVLGYLFYK